nr:hypothetical protein [Tanacetum cinerariifolium]
MIEAIRLFLAYSSFMGFLVYQMDVKSAFMYGRIEEEVFMCQPPRYEDPDYPDKVYKVEKALYGLHQALRARSRSDPTLLNNSEMATEGPGDLPVPDLQTLKELCQPSLNGRGGPIVPISIQATNFGLKNDIIQQVQNSCQFHGLSGDDANKHLDKFLHVTQSIKVNGVIDDALRLYLFPHSLTHHATAWFDRLPRNSINTFEQMAKMFLGKYFPPSMVTKLRNEITNFRPPQCSESSSSISSFFDTEIAALKAEMAEINKNLMRVLQVNQQVKAVTQNCETCGGPHSFSDCPATVGNTQNVYAAGAYQGNSYQPQGNHNLLKYHSDNYLGPPGFNQNQNRINQNHNFQNPNRNQGNHHPQGTTKEETNSSMELTKANDSILKNMKTNMNSWTNSNLELKNMFGQFMKMNTTSSLGSGTLPGNTITNPKEDLKGITTKRGTAYPGPTIPTTSFSLVVERETEATKDMVHPANNGSTEDVQPSIVQFESLILDTEPVISLIIKPVASPVSAPRPNQRPSISFADALILMPRFGPSIKSLLTNKDKLCELARTPLNERCSAILLKKLPKKLGDPRKFLIPCDFLEMAECLALADLGIHLMLLSVWNKLSLPNLSPTYFDADPRVPLILGRSFLKTGRDFIDVFEGELTLRVGKEAITFNLDQTSRCSANYSDMTANRIDVIHMACEEYSQEVLGYFDMIVSGNPTTYYDPIVSTTSLSLTSFRNSDFLLEEVDAFLALKDDPTSPEVEKMLKMCKDTNLCLNWEKSHFMVKEGIVLGHKISKEGIEVDKAKVDVITKLHHPTTVKDHFALKYLFAKKDSNARLLRWVLLLQEFTVKVIDTKGAENLAADHLS